MCFINSKIITPKAYYFSQNTKTLSTYKNRTYSNGMYFEAGKKSIFMRHMGNILVECEFKIIERG